MADGGREMIPLESDQYKNDPVINQYIMQMINTNIFWYGKTFRVFLMELCKIRNGEFIAKPDEELSVEETHYHNDSHTTFNDQRLYKGEKTQQDHEATELSVMKARRRMTGQENASRWMKKNPTN